MIIRTLSSRLRDETRALHQTLDALPLMKRLVSPTLTPEIYINILCRMSAAWLACLQPIRTVTNNAVTPPAWMVPSLLHQGDAIVDDIATLMEWGCAITDETPIMLHSFIDIDDEEQIVGCFYVLLGSSLGASFIAAMLHRHADPLITRAMSYFEKAKSVDKHEWRKWQTVIDEQFIDLQKQDSIIKGAKKSFSVWIENMQ